MKMVAKKARIVRARRQLVALYIAWLGCVSLSTLALVSMLSVVAEKIISLFW